MHRLNRVATRRLVGAVSQQETGSIRVPDITGDVRMNDAIRPGVFSSQVIAGWLEASPALRKHYGGSLDIFQLSQGDTERAGAAVLQTKLSLASLDKSVSCYLSCKPPLLIRLWSTCSSETPKPRNLRRGTQKTRWRIWACPD